ncbi:uncharacterized protein [Macrobrachium rosenbergii]|uniref:uncharacterized protein n=1 Tax=Macrobrachium rosenbergii TaxID=79674 RepID=UPI0034D7A40F
MEIASECGLRINKDKSNIPIFNDEQHERQELQRTDEWTQIKAKQKEANMAPAVITKSCSRLKIEKLSERISNDAMEVMKLCDKKDINELQKIYNQVSRTILKAPGYTIQLKEIINNLDKKAWQREIYDKTTLRIYRRCKENTREEIWCDNTEKTMLTGRARRGTLESEDRNRLKGEEDTECLCCEEKNENLEDHFLLYCPPYI